jgi:hypothetical protein
VSAYFSPAIRYLRKTMAMAYIAGHDYTRGHSQCDDPGFEAWETVLWNSVGGWTLLMNLLKGWCSGRFKGLTPGP